MTKNEKIV